ncbi:IS200/IS605 family transposase [Nitrincola tibetensis]|uniref:IS200/IS605 family transposase n=1 Tax=Nitrincola tibetensis TaxID=2219697 RepID=A0A364NM30_9GAMM|nr:IS200/IS605 family transposase [Nitrincola tibetensis]RAU18143.1 IS200/IS605 family transposase [Nitrincola tibetensis]
MYDWRTGRRCLFKNNIHLVFVTKYRSGVFTKEMLDRTEIILKETCEQMDCELLEFGGDHDHVHLMVSVHPKVAISNLVSKLKGKTSYMIRREYWDRVKTMLWGKHFWSPSYCVVSCGGASLDVVKEYINNQQTAPSERAVKTSQTLSQKKQ